MSEIKLAVVSGPHLDVEKPVTHAIDGTPAIITYKAAGSDEGLRLISHLALYGDEADALIVPTYMPDVWRGLRDLKIAPAVIAIQGISDKRQYGEPELAMLPDLKTYVENQKLTNIPAFLQFLGSIWNTNSAQSDTAAS